MKEKEKKEKEEKKTQQQNPAISRKVSLKKNLMSFNIASNVGKSHLTKRMPERGCHY